MARFQIPANRDESRWPVYPQRGVGQIVFSLLLEKAATARACPLSSTAEVCCRAEETAVVCPTEQHTEPFSVAAVDCLHKKEVSVPCPIQEELSYSCFPLCCFLPLWLINEDND